ncbi:MAG: LysR family transcriptional regulator, partial [Streptomyces sp.]|nr:LysR family transcriptional regulator [Streptomyces sp.]
HRSDVAPPRAARVLQDVLLTAARRALASPGLHPGPR